ncbi:MAG: ferric reductase-like transmembrane domain-containing protein [Acidimicrobiales bacterium]
MNEQIWWYVARSGGILAWVLVTLSVLWGLALSTKILGKAGAPAWLLDIHRWFAALSIVFTVIHVLALVADSYVHFGWSELFVPMASTYEPGGVAWGIVGFYLLIAIQITSLLMRRIPRKLWRYVHFTSFVVFAMATVHRQQAGADATNKSLRVGRSGLGAARAVPDDRADRGTAAIPVPGAIGGGAPEPGGRGGHRQSAMIP